MTRILLAGAAAFGIMTAGAMAQMASSSSTTDTTTTTTTMPSAPVPVQTMTSSGSAVRSDGDKTVSVGGSVRDSAGNETRTTITNTTYPLADLITTVKKEQRTVNGVTTETVTTTQTHPPVVGRPDVPPEVTVTSHVVTGSN